MLSTGEQLYSDLKQLGAIALEMRETGCQWNYDAAERLERVYSEKLESALRPLQAFVAAKFFIPDFNPGSPKQLREIFYKHFGLAPIKWTDTGEPSTDEDTCTEFLRCDNPAAVEFSRKLLQYRGAAKILGTYVRGMRPADGGARIFGEWRAHTAVSGRWSCTGNPLQTLDGEMRELIIASPGYLMCEADLPSAEVRTIMLFAGDDEMISLLNDGGDFYSAVSTEMFGRKITKAEHPKQRQVGKLVALASNYGASAETVWRQVIKKPVGDPVNKEKTVIEEYPNFSVRQVEALQKGYFRKCPKIPAWWDSEEEASKRRGYYLSPFDGRKLRFYGPVDRNLMANFPNQATVAWWMNRALLEVHAALTPEDRILTYVHDSLCIESPEKKISQTRNLLHSKMEGDMQWNGRKILMSPVESKIGKTLAEVK